MAIMKSQGNTEGAGRVLAAKGSARRPAGRFGVALAMGLLGCVSAGRDFQQLPAAEQSLFLRCREPVGAQACGGQDPDARAGCLETQAAIFAERRNLKMRRSWLALNGCPASLMDAVASAPPASVPVAPPLPSLPSLPPPSSLPSPPPLPPSLLAAAAPCRRSAECESDLCVRGACVTLASLTAAQACRAPEPSPPVAPVAALSVPAAEAARPDALSAGDPAPATATAEVVVATTLDGTSAAAVPFVKVAPAAVPAHPPRAAAGSPPSPRVSSLGVAHQLRDAIVIHEGDMKTCVERQLKLFPALRAEGTLVLEVDGSGQVIQAGLRGEQLQGTALEGCLRAMAARWRFPRTAQNYAVEAPLKVAGVEGRP